MVLPEQLPHSSTEATVSSVAFVRRFELWSDVPHTCCLFLTVNLILRCSKRHNQCMQDAVLASQPRQNQIPHETDRAPCPHFGLGKGKLAVTRTQSMRSFEIAYDYRHYLVSTADLSAAVSWPVGLRTACADRQA
jgi:hypothetical protein